MYRVHTGKFVSNSRTSKRHVYGFQGLQATKKKGYNCIQNFHLGRYIPGYTVGN